jgi:hypothetical protein
MKQPALTILLLLFGLPRCSAGDVPPNWMKPVQFESIGDQPEMLISVPLDTPVYSRAQLNLADLRILDAQGNEVSYLRTKRSDTRTKMIEHRWMAEVPSLEPAEDELTIEFELNEDDPFPDRLEIVTPLRNFEQRVRVYGVGDNNERLLADDVIFDYSRYMDVRRTEISLTEHRFRRFRVVIEDPTSGQESQLLQLTKNLQGETETSREERLSVERRPFRIERIQLVSTVEKHVPDSLLIREWDNQITRIQEDEEKGETLVEFETRRQPLTQLTLVTGSRNFSRKVSLQVPETKVGKIDWHSIGRGKLSRFEFGEILEENLTLKFPEARHDTYRLVVENRDSAPLEVDGLTTAGPQDQLLFLASPGVQYELHYGADIDKQPDYDTAAIRHLLSEGVDPTVAELGDEVALTEEPGRKAWTFQRFINNRYLLGGLIVLAAIILGVSLYQAGKKVSQE